MRILKLPAKILYYVSDEFNKICKNVFLCVSIQIAARISTGKSDMAIAHCWICGISEYISLSSRFAQVCSHVEDFNTRNKCVTAKLLKQGYRYHKLWKAFSKFYRRHYELISKFNVGLKSLLNQGLSEPEFYGD